MHWAEELAQESAHARAINISNQETAKRIQEMGATAMLEPPADPSFMQQIMQQIMQGRALAQDHQSWAAARFQPLVRHLLANPSDFEDFLQLPRARKTGSFELLLGSMHREWVALNRPSREDGLPDVAQESPWSVALLEQMVEWAQEHKKLSVAVAICPGQRASEDKLGQLAQQEGDWEQAVLFCTQQPVNQDRFAEVGHVMPLRIEKRGEQVRALIMNSTSELFDQPLPLPAVMNGKILQFARYVRESLTGVWPEARLFGLRTGQARQTDHQSCGFFAWHDLNAIDRIVRSEEDLWSQFAEWKSPEDPNPAEQHPMPYALAKLAQRRWQTLEQVVEREHLQGLRDRYDLCHVGKDDARLSINGAAMIKTARLLKALIEKSRD